MGRKEKHDKEQTLEKRCTFCQIGMKTTDPPVAYQCQNGLNYVQGKYNEGPFQLLNNKLWMEYDQANDGHKHCKIIGYGINPGPERTARFEPSRQEPIQEICKKT